MPVTIQVTAETAAAAANLQAFANSAAGSFKRVEVAGRSASGATLATAAEVKSAGRAMSQSLSGIAMTASLFAGPQVAQAIYPVVFLSKEIKGLAASMKLLG